MGAGIPGTGMATLFYLVSAVLMPVRELVLTVQGRSSWARWRLVCRHLAFALAMAGAAMATYLFLPRAVLPPDLTVGRAPSLLVTVVLFVAYLVVANVVALVVPRRPQLPEPLRPAAQVEPIPVAPITVGPFVVDLADVGLADVGRRDVELAEIDLGAVERAADRTELSPSGIRAGSRESMA